jgi:mRNA-degrading endonuclease RelE of RelBE toxin-antitoxin system
MTIIIVNMTPRQRFSLIYAPVTKLHLKTIEHKYYSLIRTTIENELQFEPEVETRNRKPLKRPVTFEAEWELRFGPDNRFRVFYEINIESHEVYILAIGVKKGNRLFFGGKEVKL